MTLFHTKIYKPTDKYYLSVTNVKKWKRCKAILKLCSKFTGKHP